MPSTASSDDETLTDLLRKVADVTINDSEDKDAFSWFLDLGQDEALDQYMKEVTTTSEAITHWNNVPVHINDIRQLLSGAWLNDEIINAFGEYLKILGSDTHFFNSFFYAFLARQGYPGVRRWTKKIRLTDFKRVFIPVNVSDSHWVCAVMDFERQEIIGYDSMMSNSRMTAILHKLRDYLVEEVADKNLDLSCVTKYKLKCATCPQQTDGSSCGLFVCAIGAQAFLNREISFTQDDVHGFRRWIAYYLLRLSDDTS